MIMPDDKHPKEYIDGLPDVKSEDKNLQHISGVAAASCEPPKPIAMNDRVPDELSVDTSSPDAGKLSVHDAKSSPVQDEGKNP